MLWWGIEGMSQYSIHIRDLRISSRHGVYPSEKRKPQPFVVSMEVFLTIPSDGLSDELSRTLDYDEVKLLVQSVFDERVNNLLESVAETIVGRLLSDPRVDKVSITIEKPDAWVSGVPGVTLVRERESWPEEQDAG